MIVVVVIALAAAAFMLLGGSKSESSSAGDVEMNGGNTITSADGESNYPSVPADGGDEQAVL